MKIPRGPERGTRDFSDTSAPRGETCRKLHADFRTDFPHLTSLAIASDPLQPDHPPDAEVPATFAAWRWTPLTMLGFVLVAYLVGQKVGHPAAFILALVVLSFASFIIGKFVLPERMGRPISGAIIGMSSALSGVWLLALCRRVAHSPDPSHSTGLAIGLGLLAVASLLLGCLLLTAVVLELFEPDVRKR